MSTARRMPAVDCNGYTIHQGDTIAVVDPDDNEAAIVGELGHQNGRWVVWASAGRVVIVDPSQTQKVGF